MEASTTPTDGLIGGTIANGRYIVTERVGAGAFGTVYRAQHAALGTSVAVKILHPDLAEKPAAAARFAREAKASAALSHKNTVQVLDFGAENGRHFIIMEFLEGRSLADALIESTLTLERLVNIMSQVCAGLAAAHDLDIIHRDIKPENVLLVPFVDDDGRKGEHVKVCDFGIAKVQSAASDDGRPLTNKGEVIGTPEFIAPEQARGGDIDLRCDLYACGVMLYQLTTGKLPFFGATPMAILLEHLTQPPTPPSEHVPGMPERLESIILKCLEKEPDDRFGSARELRSELVSLLDDKEARSWSVHAIESAIAPTLPASEDDLPGPTLVEAEVPALMTVEAIPVVDIPSARHRLTRPETPSPAPELQAFHVNASSPRMDAAEAPAKAQSGADNRLLLMFAVLLFIILGAILSVSLL